MNSDVAPTSLTRQTLQGILWSYLSFAGGKIATFAATIILARLLLPAEFGLMGYCLIVTQYLDVLTSAGFDNALISRREDVQEAANAAFFSNLALGLGCVGMAWLIAPAAARFFKADQLTGVLRVLVLCLPIAGLGMVPDAIIQRSLRFKTRLFADLGRALSKGLVSISLALTGFGVWSLVGGQIAGVAAGAGLSFYLAKWRPSWRFKPQATRAIWSFGLNIVVLELASAIFNNVDYLLVGRILGASALGYYTMAFRIPDLIIRSIYVVVGRVSFPVLAHCQSDPQKLREYYMGTVRYLALIVYPVGFGLALTAPITIPLFLSNQWQPAIAPTMLVSIAMAITAVGYIPGVLYKAIGRPDILNRMIIVKLPVSVMILWVSTRWGINGVAAGQITIAVLLVAIDVLVANRIMRRASAGSSLGELGRALFPGLCSSLLMSAVMGWVWLVYKPEGLLGLLLLVASGGVAYLLGLFLVSRQTVIRGIEAVRDLLSYRANQTAGMVSHE